MFFKKTVGDAILGQVSLTLSCLGLLTTFLLWPLLVIFQLTECERAALSDLPWGYLCGTRALALVFHSLMIFGITSTSTLFISLGVMISILLNSLMDHVFRDGVWFVKDHRNDVYYHWIFVIVDSAIAREEGYEILFL